MGELLRLQTSCNLKKYKEETVARCISRLNQSIQEFLSLVSIWTIDQAQSLGMKLERLMSKPTLRFGRSLEENLFMESI